LRIAFLDDIHCAYGASEGVARLRALTDVESVRVFEDPVANPRELAGFDVLIATRERTRFPREVLQELGDVRLIVQTGSKAYHVDLAAADELGITVARAEGASAQSTAELTFGLLLSLTRRIPSLQSSMRAGEWPAVMGRSLCGMRLGLVGFGAVSRAVVPVAHAFGMSVSAWSPSLLSGRRDAGQVTAVPLDELASRSDVLSVHCALNEDTRGLVDARLLGLMPTASYLLNTSRGEVVQEAAVLDALASGRLAGVGLDVFGQEPLPAEHPLRDHPDAVVTPHLGWVTDHAYGRFSARAADLVEMYLRGQELPSFAEL
jgi:phosphoglycerate dehydrogenase-like enzyme